MRICEVVVVYPSRRPGSAEHILMQYHSERIRKSRTSVRDSYLLSVDVCLHPRPLEKTLQPLETLLGAHSDLDRITSRSQLIDQNLLTTWHHDQQLGAVDTLEHVSDHTDHLGIRHQHHEHVSNPQRQIRQQHQLIRDHRGDDMVGGREFEPLGRQNHLGLPPLTHDRENMTRTTHIEHVVIGILVAATRETTALHSHRHENLLSRLVKKYTLPKKASIVNPNQKPPKVSMV